MIETQLDPSEIDRAFKAPEEGMSLEEKKRILAELREQAKPIEHQIEAVKKELGERGISRKRIKELGVQLKQLDSELAPLREMFLPIDRSMPRFNEDGEEWKAVNEENTPGFNSQAFDLYKEDYEREAKVANEAKKPLLKRLLFKKKEKETALGIAQEEANIEQEERELKKEDKEFLKNQERLEAVKKVMDDKRSQILEGVRMVELAQELEDGPNKERLVLEGKRMIEEASKINIILALPGGGLKVSNTFAQIDALLDMGYGPIQTGIEGIGDVAIINYIHGSSTGTMAAGAFMSGRKRCREIGDMFYKEPYDPEFIDLKRFWRQLRHGETPAVNIGFVRNLLKQVGGTGVPFDLDAIMSYPGELTFQLAAIEDNKEFGIKTGDAIIVDMKEWISRGLDPAYIAERSMGVPNLTGEYKRYKGKKVTDGDVVEMRKPLQEIMERTKAAAVLVLPQGPFEPKDDSLVNDLKKIIFKDLPYQSPTAKGWLAKGIVKAGPIDDELRNFAEESKEVPIAISYVPKSRHKLDTLDKDANPLTATHRAYENMIKSFLGDTEEGKRLIAQYRVKVESNEQATATKLVNLRKRYPNKSNGKETEEVAAA